MIIVKKINDNNVTRVENINGVKIIRFTPLDKFDFVDVAFSTRSGGVSKGQYSSMNLSYSLGDDDENVINNFRIIAKTLKVNLDDMVRTKQTHTTNVTVAKQEYKGMGITKEYGYDHIDGMVTDERGIVIVTSYADCVPLFFVDKEKKIIGSSHSGWRGTVGNIAHNTIKLMIEEYGCKPEDIIGIVGPSICRDCYEVSEDVAEEFRKVYSEYEIKDILTQKEKGKYLLDLHCANKYNLMNSGLLSENIFLTDVCTCCNSDMLFSHRKTSGKRGGLCGFIWLK